MKSILLSLFLITSISVSGQTSTLINEKFTTQFLQLKIDTLSKKLYRAAANQKVKAYMSDSLNTLFPLKRLDPKGDQPILEEDIEGFSFVFQKEISNLNYSYTLATLGPCYVPEIEGIQLPAQHVFYIGLGDLKNAFTAKEKSLLESLAMKRASIADFTPSYHYDPFSNKLNTLSALDDASYYQPNASFNLFREDMSDFAKSLQNVVMYCLFNLHQKKSPIYKDKSLKTTYTNLEVELGITKNISVKDSNGIVSQRQIIEVFNFNSMPFAVHTLKNDYLIEYTVPINDQDSHSVFFKYSAIKPYLLEFDQFLLETLFEEVLNGNIKD